MEEQSTPSFASADLNPAVETSAASTAPAGARLESVQELETHEDAGESASEEGEVPQEVTEEHFFDQLLEDVEKREHHKIKLDRARVEEKETRERKATRRTASVAKTATARSQPRYDDRRTFEYIYETTDCEPCQPCTSSYHQ